MARKVSQRQLQDSAALTAEHREEEIPERFGAYIDGKLVNAVTKPVLVHIKGKEPPFDSQLEPYWKLQKQIRRAK